MYAIYYSMQESLEWVSKCNSVVNLMVVFCLFCCLDQRQVFEKYEVVGCNNCFAGKVS